MARGVLSHDKFNHDYPYHSTNTAMGYDVALLPARCSPAQARGARIWCTRKFSIKRARRRRHAFDALAVQRGRFIHIRQQAAQERSPAKVMATWWKRLVSVFDCFCAEHLEHQLNKASDLARAIQAPDHPPNDTERYKFGNSSCSCCASSLRTDQKPFSTRGHGSRLLVEPCSDTNEGQGPVFSALEAQIGLWHRAF